MEIETVEQNLNKEEHYEKVIKSLRYSCLYGHLNFFCSL